MEHILSKEEPKFDYNIILVDSDKKEECSSLFQDHEDIIIETLPSFQREAYQIIFLKKKKKQRKQISVFCYYFSTKYFIFCKRSFYGYLFY